MSSEQKLFVTDGTQVQTKTRDARMARADDRFNLKLREALGSSPFILTKFDEFMNWVRGSPMFMLQLDIACCSIEMMHAYLVGRNLGRSAAGVPRVSPRQADMIIVPGTIISKFAPRMRRVCDQMPEPKFVVGMRSCMISGGLFREGYNVIKGAEEVTSVNIHIPGCSPRLEALIYGITKLQEHIANGKSSPVTVKPYELEQLSDPEHNEIADKFTKEIDEKDLVMRYNWADSP